MGTRLRYLGFSGFEIVSPGGYRIVVDPFLSGSTDHGIPPSPVPLDELAGTDLILVSHGAFDHLGQAVEIARAGSAILGCGPDVRLHALARGLPEERIAYLLSGCTLAIEGQVKIKALDVRHISLFESEGRWLSGQPLSFMIQPAGGPTIYHTGDTSLFSDLKLFGELHRPEVALICVGGVRSHGFEIIPLPPDEAALAVEWLRARVAVPMHYRPDSDAPDRFAEEVARRGMGTTVRRLSPGETIDLDRLLPGDEV